MKKKDILNLIKYHSEGNENGFRDESYKIANYFDKAGDHQLAEYIMGLLADTNTFIPQSFSEESAYLTKLELDTQPLPLPEKIKDDILGVINAIGHRMGINKFIFEGEPGTGKTETVKQIGRILERDVFIVEFDSLIDSKLGQTSKNIIEVFKEINSLSSPRKALILFDEIDALALDRVNSNDLREMGRVTSTLLKEIEKLNEDVVLIATTNLFKKFDKALIRRFDSVINFNRYSREDLIDIGVSILEEFLKKFKNAGKKVLLFKKIMKVAEPLPYPGDLRNLIKTSLAFSSPTSEYDYLRKFFGYLIGETVLHDIMELKKLGFTVREIEVLTGVSKSQVSRELKEGDNESGTAFKR